MKWLIKVIVARFAGKITKLEVEGSFQDAMQIAKAIAKEVEIKKQDAPNDSDKLPKK